MKFSMIGQEKGDLLMQVTAQVNRGDPMDTYDYLF